MKSSRRKFLQSSAGLLIGACSKPEKLGVDKESQPRTPEPKRWEPEEMPDTSIFPHPIRIGDVSDTSAILTLQTTATVIDLQVMRAEEGEWVLDQLFEQISLTQASLHLEIFNLRADCAYCVSAFSDGFRAQVTRFRTALSEGDSRIVVFGATSCMGGNLPFPNLSRAAEQDYDFFCFLGDTVYADNANTVEQHWDNWDFILRQTGMIDVCSSTSLICTWDDHEVENNWSWQQPGIATKVQMAYSAFIDAMPIRLGDFGFGLWRKLSWGRAVELFVLDCRGERENGNYISLEQMAWLKTELIASSARFKIILNSVAITDYEDLFAGNEAMDRWQGYPHQRQELLNCIEENDISGVLFIAGDFHFGQINHVSRSGEVGDQLYEVLAGPSGSFINILGDLIVPTEQYLMSFGEWNHTRFTCHPSAGTILVEYIGDQGDVIESMRLYL